MEYIFFFFKIACTTDGVTVTLPDTTKSSVYYFIDPSCYRLDACVEVNITGVNYLKSLKAYLELEPCSLMIRAGFEMQKETFILVNYEWGMYGKKKNVDIEISAEEMFLE